MFRFDFTTITAFLGRHLGTSRAGWICFFLAWLNKALVAITSTSLGGDKALYLLMARSAIDGHGLLEPVAYAGKAETQYVFNNAAYSPLYSTIAMPLLWLTRSPALTSVLIDVLAWGSLLLALRTAGLRLLKQAWIVNLMLVSLGFFYFLFEAGSSPKDCLAAGILIWSLLLLQNLLSGKPKRKDLVLLTLSLISLALIKLLYAPLAGLLLLVLVLEGWKKLPRKNILLVGLTTVSVLLLVFTLLNALKAHYPPATVFTGERITQGFFPGNLLQFYPFITSSLINTNFWGVQLSDILHVEFITIARGFQVIDLMLLPLLLFVLMRLRRQAEPGRLLPLLLLAALGMLSLIVFASVRTAPVERGSFDWTYAQDARSFLVPMLVIQLLFFLLLFRTRFLAPGLARFLLLLFLIESLHGLYFTGKQLSLPSKPGFAEELVQKSSALGKEHGRPVRILTSDIYLYRYLAIEGLDARLGTLTDISHRSDSAMYLSVSVDVDPELRNGPLEKRPSPIGTAGGYELHLIK